MTSANGWSSYEYKDRDTGEIIQTVWVNTRKVGLKNSDQYIRMCSRISRSLWERMKRRTVYKCRFFMANLGEAFRRLKADLFPMWF